MKTDILKPNCFTKKNKLIYCEQLEIRLRALLGVIETHECTCFSCDRDGETYCDCLERESARAKAVLSSKHLQIKKNETK